MLAEIQWNDSGATFALLELERGVKGSPSVSVSNSIGTGLVQVLAISESTLTAGIDKPVHVLLSVPFPGPMLLPMEECLAAVIATGGTADV